MKFEYRMSKNKSILIYKIFNDKKEIGLFFAQYAADLIDFMHELNSINFVQCIDNDLCIYVVISDFGVLQEISEESIHNLWKDFS
jgi:hypothetical protein